MTLKTGDVLFSCGHVPNFLTSLNTSQQSLAFTTYLLLVTY